MDIALNIGWVILGLAGLYYGAEWLVRGAAGMAITAGISTLVVGLTVVAFGTSMPELIVSIQANLKDSGDIALGNVIGSNICNIGLVLAIAAVMTPIVVHIQVIRRELPLLIAVSLVFVVMLLIDDKISRFEGLILALGITIYSVSCIRIASRNPDDPIASIEDEVADLQDEGGEPRYGLNILLIVAGLVVLGLGADRLVAGGEFLALKFGVSKAVIGLTLIAFGTSLPELATTFVACAKNETELAAGNAIGSCLFNLLCVVGFTALIKPINSTSIAMEDLAAMFGFALATFLLMRKGQTLGRVGGIGLLVTYLAYTAYVWIRG
ncbi:calcium/sodium antiporter [Mariniblastus fucicola]|uniref:Inner membrane protein YrbG n=1 Tax=Mariniblastus fucicola TaxID=980251 RepID=A0A5B9PPS6_9BACT|nr:calcium/sodium antiporter [Mariniblastus fucicola]QEG24481.1 Inner membrane protein YrbG [Mariniblastus fucicola]